jgi:hypothetical protein
MGESQRGPSSWQWFCGLGGGPLLIIINEYLILLGMGSWSHRLSAWIRVSDYPWNKPLNCWGMKMPSDDSGLGREDLCRSLQMNQTCKSSIVHLLWHVLGSARILTCYRKIITTLQLSLSLIAQTSPLMKQTTSSLLLSLEALPWQWSYLPWSNHKRSHVQLKDHDQGVPETISPELHREREH